MRYQTAFGYRLAGLLAVWCGVVVRSWELRQFQRVTKTDGRSALCAMSAPSKTLSGVQTRLECVASCSHQCPSPCQAVNYRTVTRLCQHFHYEPCFYNVQDDCVSYHEVTIDAFQQTEKSSQYCCDYHSPMYYYKAHYCHLCPSFRRSL